MALPTETQDSLNLALTTLLDSISADVGNQLPNMDKLTTVAIDGTGVFDKLMATASLHIQAEFDTDRIRGTDYATVYLGMMQACLQAATSFLVAWDKATLEKANLLSTLLVNLNQADLLLAEKLLTDAKLNTQGKQSDLLVSQKHLYIQKAVTEMAETNTTLPALGGDLANIVPYAPTKVAGAKGANRDVTLEQRAGYMRKAQNDLIKIATGHVDMLVSSGAATNVGEYTEDLLKLLQNPAAANTYFSSTSLLSIAVNDAASLNPGLADSMD